MFVSLYTSRVVLNTLGIQNYGIYNVVGGIVTMFGFINGAMVSATQRFFSFELGRNNYVQLRKTFNATLSIHTAIALIFFILAESIGLWFVKTQLNIPTDKIEAAQWVYHFSVLSFIITILQVPYNSIIIARERMSVYAYMSILEVILKLLIVFLLSWIVYDKLKLYGILLFIVSFIIAFIYRIYCLKKFDETHFYIVKDKALYKTLISYSGWNLFGNLAIVTKGQGINIILNIFFGTVVNAAQGIANQVNSAIYSFVGNFQMASNPQIIKSYAANEKSYMTSLVIRTSKFSFYMLYIITLPVMLEIEYILELWLKIVPMYTATFTVLVLISALIDSISGPLYIAIHATGKIKKYQVIVGTVLVSILPISFILFKIGFPPESTFVVSIIITFLAFIVRIIFTKIRIPEFSIRHFFQEIFIKNIPVVLLSLLIPLIIRINMQMGVLRFSLIILFSLISCIVAIYVIGLKNDEKIFLKSALNAFINNTIIKRT